MAMRIDRRVNRASGKKGMTLTSALTNPDGRWTLVVETKPEAPCR